MSMESFEMILPTTESIKTRLDFFRTNPNAIQRFALELLEDVSTNNYTISDPTNPFIFLLETSAVLSSNSMDESRSRARELYPSLAIKPEDLYRHMSDVDYLNQFSVPGKIEMSLIFNEADILNLAVEVPNQIFKKITIPRDSIFSISDYDFGIYYPVDIRVSLEEEIQVVYDTTTPSPINPLRDDKIDYIHFTLSNKKYLNITLPMDQVLLTTHKTPLNVNVGFNKSYEFSDRYYFCRVYTKIGVVWTELLTTHSKEIFDPLLATAQLTVLDTKINVFIPQIYISSNLIANEIRVDIYTTKGDISANLGNYSQENSRYQWRDLNSENRNEFSAPLGKISGIALYSTSIITGGGNGESFAEIRDRVVTSRNRRDVPIKFTELEVLLADRGYDLIRSIDNITDRVLLATKKLPTYGNTDITIQGTTYEIAIDEGELERTRVINHGVSYTFLPHNFFKMVDSVVSILSQAEEDQVLALEPEDLIRYLNTTTLFYNPLHYSLIYSESYLTLIPYLLTNPTILSRQQIEENTSTGYQISTDKINITYNDEGYLLRISTIGNDSIQDLEDDELACQISFVPDGDVVPVYMNGIMSGKIGKDRVYNFDLDSSYDINRNHALALKGFSRTLGEVFDYRISLNATFTITFFINSTKIVEENVATALGTTYSGDHLLPSIAGAIKAESLNILLGEAMETLFSDSRMSVSGYDYERYEADVPAEYTENVYERNDEGSIIIKTDPDTGDKYPVVLHYYGDPILDEEGNQVIKHEKGDIKLVKGEPIISGERGRLFFLNLMLANGIYYFATVPEHVELFNNIPKTLNDFFKSDLDNIRDRLLERTEMFFVPKKTMGKVRVQISKNRIIEVDSEQKITVSLFVNPITNKDNRLKATLEVTAREEIIKWLDTVNVSISFLTKMLIEKLGDNISGVSVDWDDELKDFDTFVIIDQSDSINIKQVLVYNYDNTLGIKDSITFKYIEQGV